MITHRLFHSAAVGYYWMGRLLLLVERLFGMIAYHPGNACIDTPHIVLDYDIPLIYTLLPKVYLVKCYKLWKWI